jgi:uncharacterized protein (DUF1800 family)
VRLSALPRLAILAVLSFSGFPSVAIAMDYNQARELLARTGFAARPAEIEALVHVDYARAVDQLLGSAGTVAETPPPAWINEPPPDFRQIRNMSQEERKQFRQLQRERGLELKGWWYTEMITTSSPLTEHMTLFWHNHFTSSLRKVKWPPFMYRQNILLRRYALGNFAELLHAIARDPAMILYLDSQTNRKDKPNENFARELLELFTLGEGHYSERDIKEAARAFTGWMVNRRTGQFWFNARQHDFGIKHFMGHKGNFDGDDILDIVLEQPQVAVHITAKLWREFISETPDAQEVARLSAVFRDAHYEIKPLLRAMFLSPAFQAPENRGTLTKSPVELIVGTTRLLQVPAAEPVRLARVGRYLGQDVFDPPNVKGWPGGTDWINTRTLLARQQFLEHMVRGREMGASMRAVAPGTGPWPDGLSNDNAARVLLPIPPVNSVPQDADPRTRLADLVLDPAYELK